MGKRANLMEIMDMEETFGEFINETNYFKIGRLGENMLLGLKNRILEQKVEKLEETIEELLSKIEGLEKKA